MDRNTLTIVRLKDPRVPFPDALERVIVDTAQKPLLLDQGSRIVAASRYQDLRLAQAGVRGHDIDEIAAGDMDAPELREAFEVEIDFSVFDKRAMLLNARKATYDLNAQTMILLAVADVTAIDTWHASRAAMQKSLDEKRSFCRKCGTGPPKAFR